MPTMCLLGVFVWTLVALISLNSKLCGGLFESSDTCSDEYFNSVNNFNASGPLVLCCAL